MFFRMSKVVKDETQNEPVENYDKKESQVNQRYSHLVMTCLIKLFDRSAVLNGVYQILALKNYQEVKSNGNDYNK